MSSPGEIFVVRRAAVWELMPGWYGVWYYHAPRNGGIKRAFGSRERAERFRERLEARRRSKGIPVKVNPFVCSPRWEMNYDTVTSFPEPVLDDWLRDAGLTPPTAHWTQKSGKRSSHDWYHWWTETAPKLTQEQLRRVWQALDKVHFYEVVALSLE